jgi:serine/threonine-protein kinase Chk1
VCSQSYTQHRVFEAVNFDDHRVAACKVILITSSTTEKDRKNVEKEMRVHSALKHQHVLEFLNAVVVEMKHKAVYIPGIYMLVEYAGGGDLFDKIGAVFFTTLVLDKYP